MLNQERLQGKKSAAGEGIKREEPFVGVLGREARPFMRIVRGKNDYLGVRIAGQPGDVGLLHHRTPTVSLCYEEGSTDPASQTPIGC